jgi:hypothetical protein
MKGLIDAISIEYTIRSANQQLYVLLGEAKFLRAFMYFTLVKHMAEYY